MDYTHPTKIATPPPVPPRFLRSAPFGDERATAEVKMSPSETQQTSSFVRMRQLRQRQKEKRRLTQDLFILTSRLHEECL